MSLQSRPCHKEIGPIRNSAGTLPTDPTPDSLPAGFLPFTRIQPWPQLGPRLGPRLGANLVPNLVPGGLKAPVTGRFDACTIPLSQLPRGKSAYIRRILGPPEPVHRLAEFGLRHGAQIEMFRRGNPCILRMAGSKVCLRTTSTILVEPA